MTASHSRSDPSADRLASIVRVSGDRIAALERRLQIYGSIIESLEQKLAELRAHQRRWWVWPAIALTSTAIATLLSLCLH